MSRVSHRFTRPICRRSSTLPGRGRERAFTIIEVTFAAAVLALAITATIVTMQRGVISLDTARGTTLASQVLQSEMERLRLLSWEGISELPADADVDLGTSFSMSSEFSNRFTVTRTVSTVDGHDDEMKEIVLTATWTGIDGHTHTRSFRTRYAKNGLYDYYYTLARS